MRVAVTGREGQVVRSLVERAGTRDDIEIVTVGRPEMDLLDPRSIRAALVAAKPEIVVSAAAYTAVDKAEDEPELAHAINAVGAGAVAEAAADIGVPVIHLSTDYIFSGDKEGPYRETDLPAPRSVYGRTKLAGEAAVAAANRHHVILRTAWVYSPFGKNFVRTMLGLARDRDTISVVSDQWGNPTSALDIADAVIQVALANWTCRESSRFGIFHLAGTKDINWSGFAKTVFEASRTVGGPFAQIVEISTSAYPTKAVRPRNSRLSTEKLAETYGWTAPAWPASCAEVVGRLVPDLAS